jgi:hypothetical protein
MRHRPAGGDSATPDHQPVVVGPKRVVQRRRRGRGPGRGGHHGQVDGSRSAATSPRSVPASRSVSATPARRPASATSTASPLGLLEAAPQDVQHGMAGGGHDRSRRVAGGGQPVGCTGRVPQRVQAPVEHLGHGLWVPHAAGQPQRLVGQLAAARPGRSVGEQLVGQPGQHPRAGAVVAGPTGCSGPAPPSSSRAAAWAAPTSANNCAQISRPSCPRAGTSGSSNARSSRSRPTRSTNTGIPHQAGRHQGRGRFNVRPTA